jgi:hypothetical protein
MDSRASPFFLSSPYPRLYPGLCLFFSEPVLACIFAEYFGIMDKIRWGLNKLSLAHEPGLTNAQLMLTNDDLRPGKIALHSSDSALEILYFFLYLVGQKEVALIWTFLCYSRT